MIDIGFLRENPEAVKENIRKKFQDAKLPLVDEVVDLDAKRRAAIAEVESLKAARNKLSKANGPLYGQLKKCDDLPDVRVVLTTRFHECHCIIKSGLYRLSHSFHLAFFLDLW